MTLLATLRDFFKQYGVLRTYYIAYSGGLDSHVLLSLCHHLLSEFKLKLRVVHINHHLTPQANQFENHARTTCAKYNIELMVNKINVALKIGDSLEEQARNKRYEILANYLASEDILLTAHHQDDQAETVLLQLFRGAGPKGLAAMPSFKRFGCGYHARPLLHFPRTELLAYAQKNQLIWIDDESNRNTQLARNFVRHEILPAIKHRWPSISQTLARSATHCAETQDLLTDYAKDLCEQVRGSIPQTLSVKKLLQQDRKYQRLILRSWIQTLGFPLPDAKKMTVIQNEVLFSAWDRLPCVTWQQVALRRHRDDLHLVSSFHTDFIKLHTYNWDFSHPLNIDNLGVLHANKVKGSGLQIDLVPEVNIRFREGGEVLNISQRGHRALKNLFQEWNVLPWERRRIPLIFVGDKLVGAVGHYIDNDYLAKDTEYGYEVYLQRAE